MPAVGQRSTHSVVQRLDLFTAPWHRSSVQPIRYCHPGRTFARGERIPPKNEFQIVTYDRGGLSVLDIDPHLILRNQHDHDPSLCVVSATFIRRWTHEPHSASQWFPPIFARLRRTKEGSNMIAGAYKSLLYQGILSLWTVVAFSSPSTIGSQHISFTRPVERLFDGCTRPVQRLHIYPELYQESQLVDMTASTIVFSVFAGIGLVLSVVPLYWHLKARNVGTCMYMIWTALGCLVSFVNSIVWNGNTVNWAPAWCDFGTDTRSSTQSLPLTNLCSYSHRTRHWRRISRLYSLHHSPPLLYRFPYRCENHKE